MKDKIKTILSALGFIIVILYAFYGCNKYETDFEPGTINICNNEIDLIEFYDDKELDMKSLERTINDVCEEYYYENPKDICSDYIDENKAEICEE